LACSLGLLCQDFSETIPAKSFKRNHHFNQFILKKGNQKSAAINSKSVISKTLQSGFWGKMNLKGAYKNPSLFIGNPFASQHSKRTLDKSISEFIGRTGQLHRRATHQWLRATRWERATHQRAFSCANLLRCYALGARYASG